MHTGPWGALSPEADAPDLHCVVTVFSQAPKSTGPGGGVHLPDYTLPGAILSLQGDVEEGGQPSPSPSPSGLTQDSITSKHSKGLVWRKLEGCSEIQGHRLGKQGDSYLLGNGVANDDVAFWNVPGHSGRVGSEMSDSHIHRRGRSVWGCPSVNRLRDFTSTLALMEPHCGHPPHSPARTKPRSQLTSRRTVGLRYGERGIKEAMVSTEFAGGARGIRLTSRRRSWRRQELRGQELPITQVGCRSSLPGFSGPTAHFISSRAFPASA